MRILTAITVGVVTSALVLAACDGPQVSTAPNETPSFSKIAPTTQYTATLTCNAAAIATRSYATVIFQGVLSTAIFCNGVTQATATSFSEFYWTIILYDNAFTFVKACPHKGEVLGYAAHTGKFSCKDAQAGLSAVLTLEPSLP